MTTATARAYPETAKVDGRRNKPSPKRDIILDLWAKGVHRDQIAERAGSTRDGVLTAIRLARKAGDPRAVYRADPECSQAERQERRDAILDRYAKGQTPKAIATALSLHVKAVGSYVTRARKAGDPRAATPMKIMTAPARRPGKPFDWTAEAVLRLTGLIGAGYSAADIAQRMGGGLTRSAVLGKVNRLGLSIPAPPKAEPKPRKPREPKAKVARPAPPRPHKHVGSRSAFHFSPRLVMTPPPPPLPVEPAIVRTDKPTILELNRRECRFPVGENEAGKHVFCGEPTFGNSSYCPACRALCYRPAREEAA